MLLEISSVKAFKFLSALIDWTPWFKYLYCGGGDPKVHRAWYQCNTYITPVLASPVMRLPELSPFLKPRLGCLVSDIYGAHKSSRFELSSEDALSVRYRFERGCWSVA
jgi:hypothetical protein